MSIKRRVFIKETGMIAASLLATKLQGTSLSGEAESGNPILDKKLDRRWIDSLYARGMPTTYLKWTLVLKAVFISNLILLNLDGSTKKMV